ncbi:hypothetical protein FHETE_6840 [Fusarium heterosporum]|uniref:Zn(2)-C6 fungal-type domain-containing protein n=1 Tax=Fusarium heterosporum TaxID=42747 RepID=A0A8H5T9A4_FUSHE|nr:hypothetical protein FHETE_6840 [Fusarium heterosporum]
MVGVPGKSKACQACKKRRVKCDLTRPSCLRCSRAGITCRGYERSTLWVHRTQTQPNISALSVVQDARLQEQIQFTSELKDWIGLLRRMRTQVDASESYDVATFRRDALTISENIYFPGSRLKKAEEDLTPSSWLRAVCQMQRLSQTLDHSLVAFCAIQIRLSGEPDISYDETVHLYNIALSKIIAILDSPCVGISDESLASIVILSTCELFLFHASSSWNAHAQGISEILRYRAVADTITQSWSDLCRRLCIICVIQAMVQKHSLILEPHIWRQHIGPPTEPASFGGLLDLVINIPSVMADARSLAQVDKDYINRALQIDLLIQKFHELDHWRTLHHQYSWTQSQIPVYWSVPARAINPAEKNYEDKLFPFALVFSSIAAATTWIFASSMMLDILDTVILLCPGHIPNNSMLASIDHNLYDGAVSNVLHAVKVDADRLARLLCQTIEYCYRSENGTFGPQMTCYMQATLLRYFAHCGLTRELEWCRAISKMECPGTSFGIVLMQLRPLTV